ncbi:MAG: hypothetical protein JNM48_01700 [Rhodospirillales bacterium]|nr:hypothetical protein [Rhodospirillales bacterium]
MSKVTYCACCGCLVGAPVNPCLGTDSNGQHQWVTTEPNGGIVFCVRCGAAAGGATNPCPGTDSNGYHRWEVQI